MSINCCSPLLKIALPATGSRFSHRNTVMGSGDFSQEALTIVIVRKRPATPTFPRLGLRVFGAQSPRRRRLDVNEWFSEEQIIGLLREAEARLPIAAVEVQVDSWELIEKAPGLIYGEPTAQHSAQAEQAAVQSDRLERP
jgi:hypothetical protein